MILNLRSTHEYPAKENNKNDMKNHSMKNKIVENQDTKKLKISERATSRKEKNGRKNATHHI